MPEEVAEFGIRADDLRYLAALADTGRLVATAEVLGVDHTTVARRVRALEKRLGAQLVRLENDGWELTDAGRAVVGQGRAISDAVKRAIRAVAGVQDDELTGTVRIAAAEGFGTRFVVPALARVQSAHPRLKADLVTGASHLGLRGTNFDLTLVPGPPPRTRLFSERLSEYDAALYASESYLDTYGNPATLDELQAHRFVFFVDAMQRVRELDLESYVPRHTVQFASPNIFALLEATRAGAGICLLPKFMATTTAGLRRIDADLPPQRVPLTLVARPEVLDRPEVRLVREALHREVATRQNELVWK
ncbi:LysR family transcriptional regulator [Amnibacterium setariae]|uniref:LysR family transcriptional regulator n=1 Tax=Amnibacterium setariae TaxID=2306585 RepID=UPI001314B5B5|nr:LysR family transcriptional regulator [Amnibacterium setariae]